MHYKVRVVFPISFLLSCKQIYKHNAKEYLSMFVMYVLYFSELVYNREFLLTSCGTPYVEAFRGLRLCHIINDFASTQVLEEDRILPQGMVSYIKHHNLSAEMICIWLMRKFNFTFDVIFRLLSRNNSLGNNWSSPLHWNNFVMFVFQRVSNILWSTMKMCLIFQIG